MKDEVTGNSVNLNDLNLVLHYLIEVLAFSDDHRTVIGGEQDLGGLRERVVILEAHGRAVGTCALKDGKVASSQVLRHLDLSQLIGVMWVTG